MSDNNPNEQPQAAPAKPKRQRKVNVVPPLLFIDTNIFLDFYRSRNDAGISLLAKIDGLHDSTITTCQVEMEFKKNRQKVISESVSLMKPPDFTLATPAFLSDAKTVEVIKGRIKDVKNRVEKLKQRTLTTLENPKTQDRIYQTLQRLFTNSGSLNLRRDTAEYRSVWRRALRRFLEGRPPRKKDDTSAGDSLNWEWIVDCVKKTNRDVIIVSRDADYGLSLDGKGYANNWLTEEIKERVHQKRKLILVDRLSAALKLLSVPVTREEVTSERAIIHAGPSTREDEIESLIGDSIHDLADEDRINSLIAETNALGWGCDTFDVTDIHQTDGKWIANVEFSFSGDQDEDRTWCGDQINGDCIAIIDKDKRVTFHNVNASMEEEEPEEPDEPTEPGGPNEPGEPDEPSGPDEPSEPGESGEPNEPDEPGEPE